MPWAFRRVIRCIFKTRGSTRLHEQYQKRHNPSSQCQVHAIHHATWRCTMLDLVIRGGLVVTPEDVGERDIGVQEGKIVTISSPGRLPTEAARVIEAQGLIVLPGGIEPHAHIAIPVPENWAGRPEVMTQPPEAASRAAAFGGVPTIIDFAGNLNPRSGNEAGQQSIPEEIES